MYYAIMDDQTEEFSLSHDSIVTRSKPDPIEFDLEPDDCLSSERFLTVGTMRARANSAPSTPSQTMLPLFGDLPQITIEDFSTLQSPVGNANSNSGVGVGFGQGRPNNFFPSDCRPRSRTCPEDLFRKSIKRPPTPPPTPCSKLLDFGKSRKPRYSALKKGFGFNKERFNNFALTELPEIGNDLGECADKDNEEDDNIADLRDNLSAIQIRNVYASDSSNVLADLESSSFVNSHFNRRGSS